MNAVLAPLPVPSGYEPDDCCLADPAEVHAVLREIVERRPLVTLYLNDGAEFIVTSILQVDVERGEIVLDHGANEVVNGHVLSASRLTVVTMLDHIKVQFHVARAREAPFERLPAFRAPIPDRVLRLQRRDAYRVKVPVGTWLRVPQGDREHTLRVLDLSVGGLAAVASSDVLDPAPGTVLRECTLGMPGEPPITIDLEVRYALLYAATAGARVSRFGCKFVDLPGSAATWLQRVVLYIERHRLEAS